MNWQEKSKYHIWENLRWLILKTQKVFWAYFEYSLLCSSTSSNMMGEYLSDNLTTNTLKHWGNIAKNTTTDNIIKNLHTFIRWKHRKNLEEQTEHYNGFWGYFI